MNLEYVEDFLSFSKYMSFSATAKERFMSQPALSGRIKALEHELGVQLVDRRHNTLTKAGRTLVNESSELLEAYQTLLQKIRDADAMNRDLVVALENTGTDAYADVRSLLAQLAMRDTAFSFLQLPATAPTAREVLADTSVDCVIAFGCPLASDMDAGIAFQRVPSYSHGKLAFWMHRNNPMASLPQLTWDDIDEINHPFASSIYRLWAASIKEMLDAHGVRHRGRIIGGSGESFLNDLREDEVQLYDTGIFGQSRSMAPHSQWVLKPLTGKDSESYAYIAYRGGDDNPALKRLIDFCRQEKESLARASA